MPPTSRLDELLEEVKREFAQNLRRDEGYEQTITQQLQEMDAVRQRLVYLEQMQASIKQKYGLLMNKSSATKDHADFDIGMRKTLPACLASLRSGAAQGSTIRCITLSHLRNPQTLVTDQATSLDRS